MEGEKGRAWKGPHLAATNGKRYIVHSDEKLTAFLETEKVARNANHH